MIRGTNRRTFLKLAAGGGAVAVGDVAVRSHLVGLLPIDEVPFRLWTEAAITFGHRDLIAAAVLAANPHNSQPWKFHVEHDAIDVFIDRSRALGPVDPYLRQMHIGTGCEIENLCVAALATGLSTSVLEPRPSVRNGPANRRGVELHRNPQGTQDRTIRHL
jgi:hypothetical protein